MDDFSLLFKTDQKKSTLNTKGSFRLFHWNFSTFLRTFIKDLYSIVNFQTFRLLTKINFQVLEDY